MPAQAVTTSDRNRCSRYVYEIVWRARGLDHDISREDAGGGGGGGGGGGEGGGVFRVLGASSSEPLACLGTRRQVAPGY